jgi:sugar phosphate isomerase/epimerase
MEALNQFSLLTANWLQYVEGANLTRDPLPAWPLDDLLDAASEAGFTSVGLDGYTLRRHVAEGGRIDDLGDGLRSRGLTCTDVGVLRLGTSDLGSEAETLAQVASVTGARVCIDAFARDLAHEQAIAELHQCAEILAPTRVRLALEFVAYSGLRQLVDAAALCAAVGWERCGLLVDTWHFFRSGAPWAELHSLDDERVALVHVNDGPLEPGAEPIVEGRFRRRPPGAGSFPFAEFAAALDAIAYSGPLGVEVLSDDVRELHPRAGAQLLFDSMRETWPRP